MKGLALMTLGTTARKVEVYAPGDPSLECMRYPCSKGSIDIAIASVSCLDPRHIHIQIISNPSSSALALCIESTGQSPCRPSFQGHKPFRHPSSCRKLPLGRSNLGVRCPGVATEEGCHGGPSSCDEDQHAGSAAMPAAERVVKPGFVP